MKITRTRGDTYADQFKVTLKLSGQPADLTGCSFLMTLNSNSSPDTNTAPAYQLVGVVSDPATGIIEFAPTAEQADQVGTFYFDIQMTDANGKIRTLMLDTYTYTQDITK